MLSIENEARTTSSYSYAKSLPQLLVLIVASFGLYFPYWYFRNWCAIKKQFALKVNPTLMALGLLVPFLNVWLIYYQFKKIKEFADASNCDSFGSPALLTLSYAGCSALCAIVRGQMPAAINANDVVLSHSSIFFYTILSALALLIVQKTLNALWQTEQRGVPQRAAMTAPEIAIIAAGALSMIVATWT